MALGSVLEVEPLEKVKSGILYPKAAIYGEGSLGYKWVLESMLVVLVENVDPLRCSSLGITIVQLFCL